MKQTKFSSDKDIQSLVQRLVRQGWKLTRGKKHWKLSYKSGKKITIPGSPSDCRAIFNLRKQIERIKKGKYL